MKKSFLMIARVLAVLVVLFAAVGVTQVYADPDSCNGNSCSGRETQTWQEPGKDDGRFSVCGKGRAVGNKHCGGEDTGGNGGGPGPSGGFGPFFAPRTGSVEQPVTASLLRLGGFGTLFATALAFSIRRWRKSLL